MEVGNILHEQLIEECLGQHYVFMDRMSSLRHQMKFLNVDPSTKEQLILQLNIIEESFRESQEWSLARDVQDVRVGIVGSDSSNKTAFVRRFVQGPDLMNCSSVRENSDCRVKCKLQVDGKWKLLLLREETGNPTKQLVLWADILLLVFSYSDEHSLMVLGDCYKSIQDYRQDSYDIPIMMVGVQDSKGKKLKDADVRKVNLEQLDKCQIMDVSLGSSNESVFLQACRLVSKLQDATGFHLGNEQVKKFKGTTAGVNASPMQSRRMRRKSGIFNTNKQQYTVTKPQGEPIGPGRNIPKKMGEVKKKTTGLNKEWRKKYLVLGEETLTYYPSIQDFMAQSHGKSVSLRYITVKEPGKRPPTASATLSRPHVSVVHPKELSKEPSPISEGSTGSPTSITSSLMGLNITHNGVANGGFSVPLTNLSLQKCELSSSDRCINRSTSPPPRIYPFSEISNKDRSPEVHHERTLSDTAKSDREITRHERAASTDGLLQCMSPDDYLSDDYEVHRNSLPRPSRRQNSTLAKSTSHTAHISDKSSEERDFSQSLTVEASQGFKERERRLKPVTSFKRKHQRQRSWGGNKVLDEQEVQESLEFTIVSLDSKRWVFEASSKEEKEEWVKAINSQIKTSLSLTRSDKRMSGGFGNKKAILEMRGNDKCADCGSPNPLWASLNFGCLLCIQCSGIHRNFGSHISRIRSLELDEWSPELIAVMLSIGNELSNSIWEMNLRGIHKPLPHASREEKEVWIRSKYERRDFIPVLSPTGMSLAERLLECVISEDGPDMEELLLLLAYCSPSDINYRHPSRNYCAALHYACTLGRQVVVQLLVWYGADVNVLDIDGRGPLAYSRHAGHHDCTEILQINGTHDYPTVDSPELITSEVFHQSAAV